MVSAVDLFALQVGTTDKTFLLWTPFKPGSVCVTHHISWSDISRRGIATGVGGTKAINAALALKGIFQHALDNQVPKMVVGP